MWTQIIWKYFTEKFQKKAIFHDITSNFTKNFCVLPSTLCMAGELWMSQLIWHQDIRWKVSERSVKGQWKVSEWSVKGQNLNYSYKNEEKRKRRNPYPNRIYEYDLMNATEEDYQESSPQEHILVMHALLGPIFSCIVVFGPLA